MFTRATQCMRGVLDPPVSTFSLSLYQHPFLCVLFICRFTLIINNGKDYDTVKIFGNFQVRRPPPTPSTKCDVKTHVLWYLISETHVLKCENTCFPIFLVNTILKADHVTMHGLFFEETSCGKKVLEMSITIFRHVVKNYASTSVKRGVGGV